MHGYKILVQDYKKDLNEKNIQPLSDDYIKFIRYGQHYIEKNGEGILAYISNNSFIDGIIHRQMRKSLLECFDTIYILDLHGNSKKKETALDGSKDENVFDIMQGVSINIFIKKKAKSRKLADVFHYDLYGKRDFKYGFLGENGLKNIEWKKLDCKEPEYYFVLKDFEHKVEYDNLIKLDNLFIINNIGIATGNDYELVDFTIDNLSSKFNIPPTKYDYRPFDTRYTIFDNKILQRARYKVMQHMIKDNISLLVTSKNRQLSLNYTFISTTISDRHLLDSAGDSMQVIPLYLYPDENSLETERTPNLNLEIVKEIEEKLNLKFVNEKEDDSSTFAPIDILDYIYAVLHSPTYRETYKEFLKIDFPRVPFPHADTFWQLVACGSKLRALHLLEDESLNERIIEIDDGNPLITNKLNQKDFIVANEKVTLQINSEVAISNIPLVAWEFYIGGYQPAQKWLKDRVGRELSRSDLKHYNRIINALTKTDEMMKKIDAVFKV